MTHINEMVEKFYHVHSLVKRALVPPYMHVITFRTSELLLIVLYVCCVVYQFRCPFKYLFVVFCLHAFVNFSCDGRLTMEVIAVSFMNPRLRRLSYYTSSLHIYFASLDLVKHFAPMKPFRGARPPCPDFQGAAAPQPPPRFLRQWIVMCNIFMVHVVTLQH